MLVSGVTALHAAALDGKLDTVRYLLNNGADPNKKDQPGEVPLHCAAKYGIRSAYSVPYLWICYNNNIVFCPKQVGVG
jgi:ankyrin repeat protein